MHYILTILFFFNSLHAGMQIEVNHELRDEDTQIIHEGLSDFNSPFFGHIKPVTFAVFLRDDNQQVVGGILAWMRPGLKLLYIDTLWLQEQYRKQGYGTQLMLAAEQEGKKQGCNHAQLETLPFQAEEFYKKLGYYRIGVVEKLYGEHDYIFMRKNL